MRAGAGFALVLMACQPRHELARSGMANPDARVRAAAASTLGGRADPLDLPYLLGRAEDPEPGVRLAVAEALGHFEDRRAADALGDLTLDATSPVQLAAVTSLVHFKSGRAHACLLLAYQRGGPVLRARVAALLTAAGGSAAEAVAAEAAALYARNSRELTEGGGQRLAAAEQLGRSGRPEAVERLSAYLGAESHALAAAAARGLGASGSAAALEPLEALLTEEDPQLEIVGAEALGDLGQAGAAEALSRAVLHGGRVGSAALRSLSRLATSHPAGRPAVCAALLATEPRLAADVGVLARTLGVSCPPAPLISRIGRGGDSAAALAALSELFRTGRSVSPDGTSLKLAPRLRDLLRSGGGSLRARAARAIGALQLAALLPEVKRALGESQGQIDRARDRWVGRQAGSAVGQVSSRPALFSPDPDEALALWGEASLAAVALGDPEAPEIAAGLDGEQSYLVRRLAAPLAVQVPPSRQWGLLAPLLGDSDPTVAREAVASLWALSPDSGDAAWRWLVAHLDEAENAAFSDAAAHSWTAEGQSIAPFSGWLGGRPEVIEALVRQLEQPEAAAFAALALRAANAKGAAVAVRARLEPQAPGLAELLDAARTLGDPAAVPACRPLLFHTNPAVRAAAARALLALSREGVVEVAVLGQDYDRQVRAAVRGR